MGFAYIAAGLILLFNPNVIVFDVLPDCIGYLLLYHGLFRMSFASSKLAEVRSSMWKLALITALRVLSILVVPVTTDTFGLVLVFGFGVVEAVFFIPAFSLLFEGFYELGTRFDANSVFDMRTVQLRGKNGEIQTRKIENAERLRVYTIVFFLIKTTASILPELTSLQINEESSYRVSMSQFRSLFYLMAVTVVLVFGIIWLVRSLRYVTQMRRDAVLCGSIDEYFKANVESSSGMMAALRMKKVRILMVIAAVCMLVFPVEGVNIIPTALASLFLILALAFMARDVQNKPLLAGSIAACAAAAVLSVVNFFIQIPYFNEYESMAARYIANAAVQYKPVRLWGTAEYIVALIMFALFFAVYCSVLAKHVGYVGITGNVTQFSAESRRKEMLSAVYNRVLIAGIVGVIYFILAAAYFTVAMYVTEIYLINAIVCLIWMVTVVQIGTAAYENVYERLELNY